MKKTTAAAGLVMTLLLAAPGAAGPAAPSATSRTQAQLPNLVPMAPFEIDIRSVDDGNEPALRFSVSIANEAEHAFELVARPAGYAYGGDAEAEQCVAWSGPRLCTARRAVGTLAYHDAHRHYHFEDFALYELRRFKRDGKPDMTSRGLVATSEKVSFCLQDVRRGRNTGSLYVAPWPLYYGCAAGMGVQGISPGWIDIYSWGTPGQQIPLAGIPDGTYALVLHTDPGNRVFETNDRDNRSVAGITLTDDGTKVSVVCSSAPGALRCG